MKNTPLFKFPSINQFKQTITHMKKLNIQGNIVFNGSVKLHGTNAGIGYSEKHGLWCQSHKQIITIEKDNYKFTYWVNQNKKIIIDFIKDLAEFYKIDLLENIIIIYGEFCGSKIQKNVAITGLDLMLVIFDVASATYEDCDSSEEIYLKWFDINICGLSFPNKISIYNINQFETYKIEINPNDIDYIKNQLIDLTNDVEKECPVGKYFGKIPGKDCTTGEGIVWRCSYKLNNGYSKIFRFKVKGDKHATSKVKTLTGVNIQKINTINNFVNLSVTENRLMQGISEIYTDKIVDKSWFNKIGDFNSWVIHDVKKEDMDAFPFLEDYEGKNGEEKQKEIIKLLNKKISEKCSKWLKNYILQ